MADDLDAFFDDVENVVATEDHTTDNITAEVKDVNPPSLDSSQRQQQQQPLPPNKKRKTESHSSTDGPASSTQSQQLPIRPRGVVVAAAASSYQPKSSLGGSETSGQAPPPPLPPPSSQPATKGKAWFAESEGISSIYQSNAYDSTTNGSMLPQHTKNFQEKAQLRGESAGVVGHNPSLTTGAAIIPATAAAAAPAPTSTNNGANKHIRTAGGKTWVDPSLDEWPENDFRIFVGNLASDVSDMALYQHFTKYASLQRAKVVRDHRNSKKKQQYQPQQQPQGGGGNLGESKGYGFVSFGDALDCAKAIREMDQTWLGSRPIRIKRSTWKDREIHQVRKTEQKNKNHQRKMRLL